MSSNRGVVLMASFWSKRKESMNKAGSYIKATESVSRPTAFIMTILGILVIGGLFFGVFWGARWSFEKLSGSGDNDTKPKNVAVSNSGSSTSSNTSGSTQTVTETSSTSTTTPSTPAPVTPPASVPATTANLPHTGPGSTTAFFFAVMLISYLIYRKKQLQN